MDMYTRLLHESCVDTYAAIRTPLFSSRPRRSYRRNAAQTKHRSHIPGRYIIPLQTRLPEGEQHIQLNAGTTCLINNSSDFFFSAWGRLLSHQKLNSSTPNSW